MACKETLGGGVRLEEKWNQTLSLADSRHLSPLTQGRFLHSPLHSFLSLSSAQRVDWQEAHGGGEPPLEKSLSDFPSPAAAISPLTQRLVDDRH